MYIVTTVHVSRVHVHVHSRTTCTVHVVRLPVHVHRVHVCKL